jgi:poly(ADP-ribose) glycohydrolase ARH3
MVSRESLTPDEDSACGALLGTFVGDALGMPVEGWPHTRIADRFGELNEMIDAHLGPGTYTDDTQMMIATAKSLLAKNGVDKEHMAESFLNHYDPQRGYGQGTTMVFEKWQQGKSVEDASSEIFDGGSFGNGGSMRIAPVGVAYAGDPDALLRAVREACGLTHAHPLGIGGSFLQAYSVSMAFRSEPGDLSPVSFVDDLVSQLPDDLDQDGTLTEQLNRMEDLIDRKDVVDPGEVASSIGCTSKAFESVPSSIAAFLLNRESFRNALTYAVGIGGDTDTIGAMTGAIAGAYHGVTAIPDEWWNLLENGPDGRDEIMELSVELVETFK